MAKFTGTKEEFLTFIGGYTRNKVQLITKSFRKNKECQAAGCHKRTKLQAAHIKGKERVSIINNIISNYHISENIIEVDLNKFETEFMDAHSPIEETIIALCPVCHRIYDKEGLDTTIAEEDYNIDTLNLNESKALVENERLQENNEIDKVQRKIERWFSNPSQINSQILIKFLELSKSNSNQVTIGTLERSLNIDNFKTNFYQMLYISDKNHAKVFSLDGNQIKLWSKVSNIILTAYTNYQN